MTPGIYVARHWPRPGQPAWRPGTQHRLAARLGVRGDDPRLRPFPAAADRGDARIPRDLTSVSGPVPVPQTRSVFHHMRTAIPPSPEGQGPLAAFLWGRVLTR